MRVCRCLIFLDLINLSASLNNSIKCADVLAQRVEQRAKRGRQRESNSRLRRCSHGEACFSNTPHSGALPCAVHFVAYVRGCIRHAPFRAINCPWCYPSVALLLCFGAETRSWRNPPRTETAARKSRASHSGLLACTHENRCRNRRTVQHTLCLTVLEVGEGPVSVPLSVARLILARDTLVKSR
jgi:hypothetical protein